MFYTRSNLFDSIVKFIHVIIDSNNYIHILEFLVGERFKVLGGISFARVVVHVAVLERELFSDFLTVKGPVKSYFVTNVKN